jgi:hypothetical protein
MIAQHLFAALLLGGCSERHYLSEDDAGSVGFDSGSRDGGFDAGSDAGPAGPDAWLFDAGPPFDARRVWPLEGCHEACTSGSTGDGCAGAIYCETTVSDSADCGAYCDLTGILTTIELAWGTCGEPVPAWTSCEDALAAGSVGQACSGTWRCVGATSDRCCVETAACNPRRIGGSDLPPDTLMRSRVCVRDCPSEPFVGRTTREACPSDMWRIGDPEIREGDGCTGEFTCAIPSEAFLSSPGHGPGLLEAVPAWCDGAVFHVAPAWVPTVLPRPRCEGTTP